MVQLCSAFHQEITLNRMMQNTPLWGEFKMHCAVITRPARKKPAANTSATSIFCGFTKKAKNMTCGTNLAHVYILRTTF